MVVVVLVDRVRVQPQAGKSDPQTDDPVIAIVFASSGLRLQNSTSKAITNTDTAATIANRNANAPADAAGHTHAGIIINIAAHDTILPILPGFFASVPNRNIPSVAPPVIDTTLKANHKTLCTGWHINAIAARIKPNPTTPIRDTRR
jgi:hypothetical protein